MTLEQKLDHYRLNKDEFEPQFVEPQQHQAILDCLKRLNRAFHLRRFSQAKKATPGHNEAIGIIEQFRVNTQHVRNAGYQSQMKSAYAELFSPLDSEFERTFGVCATSLIRFFEQINIISNRRLNDYLHDLKPALTAESPQGSAERFADSFIFSDAARSQFFEFVDGSQMAHEELKQHLMWQTYLSLHQTQLWDIDDLCLLIEAERNSVRDIIRH